MQGRAKSFECHKGTKLLISANHAEHMTIYEHYIFHTLGHKNPNIETRAKCRQCCHKSPAPSNSHISSFNPETNLFKPVQV